MPIANTGTVHGSSARTSSPTQAFCDYVRTVVEVTVQELALRRPLWAVWRREGPQLPARLIAEVTGGKCCY